MRSAVGRGETEDVHIGGKVFQVVRSLGEGGQGFIFLVVNKVSGQEFVLKRTSGISSEVIRNAKLEIALMKSFSHPNIVEYYCDGLVEKSAPEISLVMEACLGGHLLDYVNKRFSDSRRPLQEKEILSIFSQACHAVEYLHSHNPPIAHRDIKLENLLLTTRGVVKLCDFGSCTTERTRCETKQIRTKIEEEVERYTTPNYRAPELIDLFAGYLICEQVDVWALSCVLFALCYRRHAFEDGSNLAILNCRYTVPDQPPYDVSISTMYPWLFRIDPEKRPRIGDLTDYVDTTLGVDIAEPASSRGTGSGMNPNDTSSSQDSSSATKEEKPRVKASRKPKEEVRKPGMIQENDLLPKRFVNTSISSSASGGSRRTPTKPVINEPDLFSSFGFSTDGQVSSASAATFDPFGDASVGSSWEFGPVSNNLSSIEFDPFAPTQSSNNNTTTHDPKSTKNGVQAPMMIFQQQQQPPSNPYMQQQQSIPFNPYLQQQQQPNLNPYMQQQQSIPFNPYLQQQQQPNPNPYMQQQPNPNPYLQQQQQQQQQQSPPPRPNSSHPSSTEQPSMNPLFFSNPGLNSGSYSGFVFNSPQQQQSSNGNITQVPLSQHPQFYSQPGTYRR